MNKSNRLRRHLKIRKKIMGSKDRPRIAVFRSNKHIFVQVIDDSEGRTIATQSDLKSDKKTAKKERAYQVGITLAQELKKKKIETIVFDRGGFLYHGRVAEVAKGLREGGLKF